MRGLQRIAQQIQQGQFQTSGITAETWQVAGDIAVQGVLGGVQLRAYGFNDRLDQDGRGQLPGLDGGGAAIVQQLVDGAGQAADLTANAVQIMQLLVIQIPAPLQASGPAIDHTQRRPQFMGNAPGHAADGDHLLVVLELRQQLGFRCAVGIQFPVGLLDAVEHVVQAPGQSRHLTRAFQCGAVGQLAPGDPLHMLQQLVHMPTHAAIMPQQHPGQNHQTEQPPDQPGNDGQLLERMAKVTGPAGDLDQTLNLPGGIKQR